MVKVVSSGSLIYEKEAPINRGLLLRRKYRRRWTSSSRLRDLGRGFNGYPQSEGFQAGEEALLDAGGIPLVEVVLAELVIGGAVS